MKVINIHQRVINQPKDKISELLGTLSSKNDMMFPTEKWPRMKLNEGLKEGSKGGHGPIRYDVQKYSEGTFIQFKFTKPIGFQGIHRFDITALDNNKTEIKHTIEMETSGTGTAIWLFAVRWLHDALLEDSFDKVENHFLAEKKKTKWNIWVKILRTALN